MKLLKRITTSLNKRKPDATTASVRDFPSGAALKKVLEGKGGTTSLLTEESESSSSGGSRRSNQSRRSSGSSSSGSSIVNWKLTTYDKEDTEPQTMEQELKRLQNLQEYFLLDSKQEDVFDSITSLASLTFDTPVALVSLVDLGRQWFMSNVGLDAEETPRDAAFCAHVVVNKYNMLVVPDASKDFRFKDNPLVTDGIKIRFYAGAALVSPEGYKLGTLCIISPVARPQGLSAKEQSMLHGMASIVVHAMVSRKDRLVLEQHQNLAQDLGHSLAQVASTLQKTQQIVEHTETNVQVPASLELSTQICKAAARSLLEQDNQAKELVNESTHRVQDSAFFEATLEGILEPKTDLEALVANLGSVLETFPFKGSVILELDATCPTTVVAEDLLLFRSAINLVSNSMQRSSKITTPNEQDVHFRLSHDQNDLIFEVEDSGVAVSQRALQRAFGDEDSLLGPVATMIHSMGGSCGMRCGSLDGSRDCQKCTFWFRIPLELPNSFICDTKGDAQSPIKGLEIILESKSVPLLPTSDVTSMEDPFKAALIQSGCIAY